MWTVFRCGRLAHMVWYLGIPCTSEFSILQSLHLLWLSSEQVQVEIRCCRTCKHLQQGVHVIIVLSDGCTLGSCKDWTAVYLPYLDERCSVIAAILGAARENFTEVAGFTGMVCMENNMFLLHLQWALCGVICCIALVFLYISTSTHLL